MTSKNGIHIAVVGHTNAGKTSFLRTLLRTRELGEVSPLPSTTRDVSCYSIHEENESTLSFYDTPGLEESRELYNYIQQNVPNQYKHDGPKQLEYLLADSAFNTRFSQEAKVLQQLMKSDAALVVIDTRASLLEKFFDELYILKLSGVPLVLVLNFSSHEADVQRWEKALRNASTHNLVAYDNVHVPFMTEVALFEQLSSVLPKYKATFNAQIEKRKVARLARQHESLLALAELAVNVASYGVIDEPSRKERVKQDIQQQVMAAEQRCVQSILALYGFEKEDTRLQSLPVINGHWQEDLFDQNTWKQFGISVAGAAASGGVIGASIDVMTGGLSLGLGVTLGSLIGVAYQGAGRFGQKVKAKWQGKHWFGIEPEVIYVLLARQLNLIQALGSRGMAAEHPVEIKNNVQIELKLIDKYINRARKHPEWSAFQSERANTYAKREQLINEMTNVINNFLS